MFDWLYEGRPGVFAVLAVVAVILAALWWRDRRRAWLYGLAGVAFLAGGYFLLDRLVETRDEQISRRLQELASAVRAGDPGRVMQQVAAGFNYHGVTREAFRARMQARLTSRFITDLTIWNVQFPDASGKVIFNAKPKGGSIPDNAGFIVHAQFVQEEAGVWRMKSFEVFDPLVNSNSPIDVSPYVR